METYLNRLSRVLDVEYKQTPLTSPMLLPRPRDRRVDVPEIDINMLDFLSLYGCELQLVVGERNSILGRLMTPLNQLRYDLLFIESAQQCLMQITAPRLKTSLQQAIEQKRLRLPETSWNAIWAGEPMAELLTLSKGPLKSGNHERAEQTELVAGLSYTRDKVKQLARSNDRVSVVRLSQIQHKWTFSHKAGQLLNSARLITMQLAQATALIEQRLHEKPLCYLSKPNAQARRVKGVFFHVYIARVQPYISEVSRAGKQIFSLLDEIAGLQTESMPESFKPYYRQVLDVDNESGVWGQFEHAVERHTKSWQALLTQCGMQPMAA